jgi:hypothetical protein
VGRTVFALKPVDARLVVAIVRSFSSGVVVFVRENDRLLPIGACELSE